MELSGAEVKQLRLALKDSFKEGDLKQFLREDLNLRWHQDIEGGTYDAKIASLIETVESRGIKIFQKLVIGIARERSKNSKIKEFVEIKIADLIEHNIGSLSKKALVDIINILERTNNFNDIWMIGKNILSSKVGDCYSQEVKSLANSNLSNWFKCFILLKLFLEAYPGSSDYPNILALVQNLLQKSALSNEIKRELREWLQEVNPNFTSQATLSSSTNESQQPTGGELKAHLMITVNSEQSKYRVIASLLCIAPTGNSKEIPVNLNPQSNERGISCTKRQLPKKLAEFIQKCLSDSLSYSDNLLGCNYYKLIIELFLPIELLCEPIDRENIFGGNIHFAAKYPLVIRSYDRLSKAVIEGKDLWNEFVRSSAQFPHLLEVNSQPKWQNIILPLTDLNSVSLMSFKEKLKKSIGIRSNCPVPACPKQKYRLLLEILDSGIPIVFWSRSGEPSFAARKTGINRFLQVDLLCDRYRFIEEVRGARARALDYRGQTQERWLRHLTLLWDDPKLMPPMDLLQVGGKTSS
ncbi:VMAP-C domain-containing protein [Merismopedia glauca]|uniref:Uncharacterized protein n=1 Tax=Merismopedia glauca CCAP 1448/3 TaxID=1296344 RepID=A0A2T1C3C7_9CYAN|nr:effector-associated domain EAD1-containing protein [Merismopedia glauca]PSB02776.1 hypothetical protein C7B64_11530 [Merismopedia glauca CCAP 1448/3]